MKGNSRFSIEERIRILHESAMSGLSDGAISRKYGILGHSTLSKWRKNLEKWKKSITFAPEIRPQVVDLSIMKRQTPEELEQEVQRLRKQLEWSELQNKALNVMIDIAESQGIKIRKKSGAKQ